MWSFSHFILDFKIKFPSRVNVRKNILNSVMNFMTITAKMYWRVRKLFCKGPITHIDN